MTSKKLDLSNIAKKTHHITQQVISISLELLYTAYTQYIYCCCCCYLHTLSKTNTLSKYTDDTSLISPQFTAAEFNNLLEYPFDMYLYHVNVTAC